MRPYALLLLLGTLACHDEKPTQPIMLAPTVVTAVAQADGVTIVDSLSRVIPSGAMFDTLFAPNSSVTLKATVTGNLTSPGTPNTPPTVAKIDTVWTSGTPRTIAKIDTTYMPGTHTIGRTDTLWTQPPCYRDHSRKGRPLTVCPPKSIAGIDTTWVAGPSIISRIDTTWNPAVPPQVLRVDTTWNAGTTGSPGQPYPVTIAWRAEAKAAGDSGVTWDSHLAGSLFVATAQAKEAIGYRLIARWVRGGDGAVFEDTLVYAVRRAVDSVRVTVARDSVAVGDSVLATATDYGVGTLIDPAMVRDFRWAVDTNYIAVRPTTHAYQVWLVGKRCTCDPVSNTSGAASLGIPQQKIAMAGPESELRPGFYRLAPGGLFYSRFDTAGRSRIEATIGAPQRRETFARTFTFTTAGSE